MKKAVILIAILLILITVGFSVWNWFDHTYVILDSELIRRDLTQFTVTGDALPSDEFLLKFHQLAVLDIRRVPLSPDEFDRLQQLLPVCEILWNIPFQGNVFPHDTKALAVSSLTEEDMKIIPYFKELQTIDAESCQNYEILMDLQAKLPQLNILYTIELNGKSYSLLEAQDVNHLTLADADLKELSNALPCFLNVQEIEFTGVLPENEAIYELMCRYPNITFVWDLNVCGVSASSTATTLILSGISMESTDEVESMLKYFPNLVRVEMCDCGISTEEMAALSKEYPEIRFVWTIKVGNGTLRTDVTAFIPYKLGYHMYNPLFDRDCTELKYCVDLVCLDLGHMRIRDISFLREMPKLKYLILADIPCSDFSPLASLTELIYLEIFVTSFTDHELLLGMTKLEDLNIAMTPAKDVSTLQKITSLKRLWTPGVKIDDQQFAELEAALPNTLIRRHAPHSTAKGWRNHQNYRDMRDLLGMFYME